MKKIKKIIALVAMFVWVLGIGGAGYLFYYNEPFFGVINLLIMLEALPYVKGAFDYLQGKEG